jgi:preprotein translocase SecE subunit
VARDRKRAKQRRERRGTAAAVRGTAYGEGTPQSAQGQVVRADLPGALEHAGAEADEFDAALIRGAGGVPVAPDAPAELEPGVEELEGDGELSVSDDALQELQAPGGPTAPGGPPARRGGGGGGGGAGGDGERPSGAPLRGGNRAIGFLRASWAELQRVQWPDRRQVTQATAVVLGFVAIAGAYLGLADYVAKEIVEFIL